MLTRLTIGILARFSPSLYVYQTSKFDVAEFPHSSYRSVWSDSKRQSICFRDYSYIIPLFHHCLYSALFVSPEKNENRRLKPPVQADWS